MAKKATKKASPEKAVVQAAAKSPASFRFVINEKEYDMTFVRAFTYAHRLLKKKNYEVAGAIFEKLTAATDRGPRALIMLAICRAGMSDYKGAHDVLDRAFPGEDSVMAAELQDIVVMSRMGFKKDAMQDLVRLVNEHKELPTLCLWLGDMLEAKQELAKARQCWQLAIKRDRPKGAIAQAAKKQLLKYSKQRQG